MLDLLSAVFSFIGILQNINKKTTLAEKVSVLKEAVAQIDAIYLLLSEAKSIHDDFENFGELILYQTVDKITGTKDEQEKQKLLDTLFGYHLKLVTHDKAEAIPTKSASHSSSELPISIKTNIEIIEKLFPEHVAALESFREHMNTVKDLYKKENFGKDLHACLTIIEDLTRRIQGKSQYYF